MEHELSYSNLEHYISSFDVISFSLWDTLIARCVLQPQDVFFIAEKRAGVADRSFVADRIHAEQIANACFGKSATLSQIYHILEESLQYSRSQALQLMEAELQTEIDVAVPRIPMVRLLQEQLELGKRVLICSDSYLSSEYLRKLLDKCGIPTTVELWSSCEKGDAKESNAFWARMRASVPADKSIVHLNGQPKGNQHPLHQFGIHVVQIQSGMDAFKASSVAPYLSPFFRDDLACSLFMGYFIHKACFNSPFVDCQQNDSVTGIWMGAALACFMDYLVSRRDNSLLLFVTREGYLLHPTYTRYCAALGITPQESTLFFASRSATLAAMAVSENSFQDALRFSYSGTLGHLMKNRFNFDLPEEDPLYHQEVTLPDESSKTKRLLKPHLAAVFANSQRQKEAYIRYIRQVNPNCRPMTVVDVGYSGTIQYALSRILLESVGGHYMYLTEKALPGTIGCAASCLRHTREGSCPIFDNLLFLEASMQVPFGQLQQMRLEEDKIVPIFNQDSNMSIHISAAQEQYIQFVEWAAGWKRILGNSFRPNFALAEAIWITLLKFDYLPKKLLDSFWLADNFTGTPLWRYDTDAHIWVGQNKSTPLTFTLLKAGTKLSPKQQLKYCVKKYIPRGLYAWAKNVWNRYWR